MSKQKNSYPSDFVGGFKPTFKQFSIIFRFFSLVLVGFDDVTYPSTFHPEAMTSFTELLARTKPAPEPEVAEAPAEAEAASWGVALGRVGRGGLGWGWVGWVGLGGHLEWVPFFFSMESWRFESNIPHRSGGCVFFLCVCVSFDF